MRTAAAVALAVLVIAAGGAEAGHRRHHRALVRHAPAHARLPGAVPPYGQGYDPTPTCRYADGTPFDPDIIGGPNHVGDGGPAANLGGFNPCGLY